MLSALKREFKFVSGLLRMLKSVKDVDAESDRLIADELEKRVDAFGPNLAFIEDETQLTYDDMESYANKVAAWALAEGCKSGDTVAIFVRNRAEYVPLWFGLSKVGVIPALLNFQLTGSALAHCINISEAKLLIVDHEMGEQYTNTAVPNRPAKSARSGIKAGDQCMKMFTSGTTGLPKAAKVTHVRAQNYMRGMGAGAKAGPKDRMMMVLPMYHATMFTYVGELCRFLLTTPVHALERKHSIRWMVGNGLREEVWTGFVERFNIPHVIEFYGATEGNASLINLDGPAGAVGRVPNYLKFKFNLDIIRYDVDSNLNPRGSDGFCVRADDNEVGELIAEIRNDDARFRFEGYQTKEATQKKILRDVFNKGDAWFRTGDLLRRDNLGYFYFVDRVGDTYRWRAENVATGEVAAALSKFKGITQANVYGVEVPGYDGRAGMGAIVSEGAPDMKALKAHIEANLPHYAQPVFLRLSEESDTTSTFKFKKTNLVKAGFNPANISEPIYFANPASGEYEKVTTEIFNKICSGAIRL